MSETRDIPDDVLQAATEALVKAITVSRAKSADAGCEIIARAIMAERERCAKIAEDKAQQWDTGNIHPGRNSGFHACWDIAIAIRGDS